MFSATKKVFLADQISVAEATADIGSKILKTYLTSNIFEIKIMSIEHIRLKKKKNSNRAINSWQEFKDSLKLIEDISKKYI